jgi:hypothetical protein
LAQDGKQVNLRWEVPEDLLPEVYGALDFTGDKKRLAQAAPDEDRGVPVLIALIGVASIPHIADAIIRVYRDMFVGGVVVDACNNTLSIRHDSNLPGTVTVVRCAENITIIRSEEPEKADLVSALGQALSPLGRRP